MPRHFGCLYREIKRKKNIFFLFLFSIYIYHFYWAGRGTGAPLAICIIFLFFNMHLLVNIAKFCRKNAASRRIFRPAGLNFCSKGGALSAFCPAKNGASCILPLKKGALSRPLLFNLRHPPRKTEHCPVAAI